MDLHELEGKSSNHVVHYLLVEVKEKKKISSTDLLIEKSLLESKRHVLGELTFKKKME